MALPVGEAGINAIPNVSAMQSSIGEETGLYIFPVSALAKTQRVSKRTTR